MRGAPLPPISLNNTALVIHDMQNDFLKESLAKPEMAAVVRRVRALIDQAHLLPIPVIYTRVEMDPSVGYPAEREPYLRSPGGGICFKNTQGSEIIESLKPTPADFIITKVRSSAFYCTQMDALLRIKGIWILIVVGGSTNWGVEWLARDAKARDIVCVALRDCTYSSTPEIQEASLANIDSFLGYVMDSVEVSKTLSTSAKGTHRP
jgi:nicotinamidase-related amidase